MCVYSFNKQKDGQTYHRDSSTNTNYATITEYKLREAKVLTTMDPGGRTAGGCCGDEEAIEDMRYKVHGVSDW